MNVQKAKKFHFAVINTMLRELWCFKYMFISELGGSNTSQFFNTSQVSDVIGGGAYCAGRAAAHLLFGSCGPPLSLPTHFLGDVNFFFLYIAIMTGENFQ